MSITQESPRLKDKWGVSILLKQKEEEGEEFIQKHTRAGQEARFLMRWGQHAVAQHPHDHLVVALQCDHIVA